MSILEGELAQTIADALLDANIPYAMQIVRYVEGDPSDWESSGGEYVRYDCQGFTEEYDVSLIAGGFIQTSDVKVVIIAPTLAVMPEPTDIVTVRGRDYAIISVTPDPAMATIALQARG